jgi:hypothetical protein
MSGAPAPERLGVVGVVQPLPVLDDAAGAGVVLPEPARVLFGRERLADRLARDADRRDADVAGTERANVDDLGRIERDRLPVARRVP